jgi:hypothetical protein
MDPTMSVRTATMNFATNYKNQKTMKNNMKSIYLVFATIAVAGNSYSQITIGNIEKKEEEKIVSRPEPYDSLKIPL